MPFPLTDAQRSELDAAMAGEKRVRRWQRYRAIVLRGEGLSVPAVARTLGCSQASIYAWTAAWREEGVAGLAEGAHRGGPVKLGPAAEAVLTERLASDPQDHGHRATGWTVPLRQGEVAAQGTVVGERTIRRALPRLWGIAGSGPATSWVGRTPRIPKKGGRDCAGGGDAGRRRRGLGG